MNTENSPSAVSEVCVQCENIEPPPWIKLYESHVVRTIQAIGFGSWEITVVLTDDTTIQSLNRDYRSVDAPTDVLSFSQNEGPSVPATEHTPDVSGDIVVSLVTVKKNAKTFGVPFEEELRRVTTHGLLHLGGHGHKSTDVDSEPMLQLQEQLLNKNKEKLF